MTAIALAARQFRYENASFWRNPPAAFFTFALPLLFLFILTSVFGNEAVSGPGGEISGATFYVPAIVALSVITACYTNLAMTVSISRERGTLKRLRGTPLPPSSYMAARIAHSVFLSILLVGIVLAFGVGVYGVELPDETPAAFLVTIVIGAASFCALGLAMTSFISSEDAAPATINGLIIPLEAISGIFFPIEGAPDWLLAVANVFPLKPFRDALIVSFTHPAGSSWQWDDLAVVALWGIVATVFAVKRFSWQPRR